MNAISKLHFITTSAALAEQACAGGVDWIQLRLKDVAYDEYRKIALEVQAVCKRHNATFIVNDNVALAKDIQADGVHIGKEDMAPGSAREILGPDLIIGCTANTFEDIKQLSGKTINYIGLGPYRFTNTKQNLSPVLGVEGFNKIFSRLKNETVYIPPIIGIGGITEHDVAELLNTGLHGIAVSGAIAGATDVSAAAGKFKELLKSNSYA